MNMPVMKNSICNAKRLLDLALSVFVLVLLSPVMLLAYIAVALALGRPVFFRQIRPGLHGRPFTVVKFRTMTNDCDANGKLKPDAERLSRLGRLLRKTSLDELPQ